MASRTGDNMGAQAFTGGSMTSVIVPPHVVSPPKRGRREPEGRDGTGSGVAKAGLALASILLAVGPEGFAMETQPGDRPATEVVVEIRVHGNHSIPDAEIVQLAGVRIDEPVSVEIAELVRGRLLASGRFASVDVRRRYRSLDARGGVVLILLVDEREVPAAGTPVITGFRRLLVRPMVAPILDYEEGYGISYGARAAVVDLAGRGGRVSLPLTWGAVKRAAAEVDQPLDSRWLNLVRGGLSLSETEHPHFRIGERRAEARVEAAHRLVGHLHVRAHGGWSSVTFGGMAERFASYGVALSWATGPESAFPRDTVAATAAWEELRWQDALRPPARRIRLEARAFKGLVGQSVVAVRAQYVGSDVPLPPYEQALLGGAATLRGSRVGAAAGDRLAAGSVELRLPLDSPLSAATAGVSLFGDIGGAASASVPFRRTRFGHGAGVGFFVTAPFVRLQLDVAHDLRGSARAHVTARVGW